MTPLAVGELIKSHPLSLFPDFRRFFAGRVISAIGDKFFSIALSWWVVSSGEPGSKFHLGLLMAVSLLPVVLFGPFMGTLADRFNRKRCMLFADAARGVLVGTMAGLLAADSLSLWALYPLCFLLSLFVPLFESSANGSLAELTDPEHVSGAAAVNSSVIQFSNFIGAAVGGFALASLNTIGAFALNALSFLLSFLLIFRLRATLAAPISANRPGYLSQMREGFRYLGKDPPMAWLLALFGLVNFFVVPLLLFIPVTVKFGLQKEVTWVAIFEGSLALGSVTTALALSFMKPGRVRRRIFCAVLLTGLTITGFSLANAPCLMAAMLLFCGAGFALVNASAMGLFQRRVPNEVKGRFFALLTTIAYAVMPLAFMLNGFLVERFAAGNLLLLDGLLVTILSFAVLGIPGIRDAAAPRGVPPGPELPETDLKGKKPNTEEVFS